MIILRTENSGDFEAVERVHLSAFPGTGEAKLVRRLRLSNAFVPELSIVAVDGVVVVGHVLYSKVELLAGETDLMSLSLAPIAVLPEWQRKGVGSCLVFEGISRATELGFASALVLGDPKYYCRFGFRPEWVSKVRSAYSCADYMGLELKPGALSNMSGATVTYPEAFSEVNC